MIQLFYHSLSIALPHLASQRRQAKTGRDIVTSYKIDYVAQLLDILNGKGSKLHHWFKSYSHFAGSGSGVASGSVFNQRWYLV